MTAHRRYRMTSQAGNPMPGNNANGTSHTDARLAVAIAITARLNLYLLTPRNHLNADTRPPSAERMVPAPARGRKGLRPHRTTCARSAVRRDGGSLPFGPRLPRVANTRRYSPQSSATSGASASLGGARLTISSSTRQSGHRTISPSTASAANVIVASHSGQLAFTGLNLVRDQGHVQQRRR